MKTLLLCIGLTFIALATLTFAQEGPPPLPPGYEGSDAGGKRGPVVLEEQAAPVVVNGKRVDDLTDDEKKEFLEQKITEISQDDGEVQLVHVAPGYPVTITFEEPIQNMLLADSELIKADSLNDKTLVLRALDREGDTSLQVFFQGNKLRIYHIFVEETFATGETAIRVAAFSDRGRGRGEGLGWLSPRGMLDVRTIAQVIKNYDALVGERVINSRMVKRSSIFRRSHITGFTTYNIYQFASDPAAITFAYQNPYPYAIRYDESRLRLAIGNVRYIPDYVSFHRTVLAPGEATTGFAVIGRPAFRFDQPFDLVWK